MSLIRANFTDKNLNNNQTDYIVYHISHGFFRNISGWGMSRSRRPLYHLTIVTGLSHISILASCPFCLYNILSFDFIQHFIQHFCWLISIILLDNQVQQWALSSPLLLFSSSSGTARRLLGEPASRGDGGNARISPGRSYWSPVLGVAWGASWRSSSLNVMPWWCYGISTSKVWVIGMAAILFCKCFENFKMYTSYNTNNILDHAGSWTCYTSITCGILCCWFIWHQRDKKCLMDYQTEPETNVT